MKKLNLLLSMFLIAGTVFVTSCNKDEDDPAQGPVLTIKGGGAYTSSDATVQIEEPILVGITGTSEGANLTKFKFSIVSNNVPTVFVDSVINTNAFNWETEITFSSVGDARLLFELWDKNNVKVEKSFTVTVEDAGMEINKFLNVEFGSWNDAVGSFFSTSEGIVYSRGQLTTSASNQLKIDFLFFKGVDNANTIASPDDVDANTIAALELSGWTNKNQTRFNTTTVTGAQFDAIGDTYQFPVFNMGTQTTKVNALVEGQVILFRTQDGKLGLIRIEDLYSRGDRAKLDIIVQK